MLKAAQTGKSLKQRKERNEQNEWLTDRKLHVNKEKTCYTVFTPN